MDRHLYSEEENRFARMVNFKGDGGIEVDSTVDASLYAVFAFGAFAANDEKVVNTMQQVYEKLWCKTDVGVLARYEDDYYHRASYDVPGNPWLVTTLWLAQYYVARGRTKSELDKDMEIMEWVADRALQSGVLAEQVDPMQMSLFQCHL